MSNHKSIPVVLVGGFLGSGKTTLMRRLLTEARRRELKLAVIVNEFGAMDVDSNILRELEKEAANEILMGISGGCACCTGQDELHWTLLEIGQRDDATRPDIILIEASGLADPILLIDILTAAPLLPLLHPASVVGVVDAAGFLSLPPEVAPLLRRQVEMSDLVVLNKTDLVSVTEIDDVQNAVAQINRHARLEAASHCNINFQSLWQRALKSDPQVMRGMNPHPADETAPHAHFGTVVLPLLHPVERAKLENALRQLPAEVWRAKGFVQLRGSGLHLLQGTGGRYQLAPFSVGAGTDEPQSALVFIGSALDRAEIISIFRNVASSMLY